MSESEPLVPIGGEPYTASAPWFEPALGLAVGLPGGGIESVTLHASLQQGLLLGAVFGLIFACFLRAAQPAPGLA